MSTTDVLIVGAGPVGMVLAMELSIQRVSFRIVEKASTRSNKSRAIAVHTRTMELLSRYGNYMDELLSKATKITGNTIWVHQKKYQGFRINANATETEPKLQFEGPFTISQVDTEEFLEKRLRERNICIERPVVVESIVQDDDGATAVLAKDDGSEETVRCKYVVGCDGAHSVVRHSMDLTFEGDAYPQDFILADTHIDWDMEGIDHDAQMMIGDGMVLILPMQPGMVRIIASRPEHVDTDKEPTLKDFDEHLAKMIPTDKSFPKPKLYDPFWVARFHLHHRCVSKYRDGRFFVAGDAAHLHSPVGGQGMNTGIQDSINLGWKLASVLRGEKPEIFLDSYHEERWPIGQNLLKNTDQMFTFLTSTDRMFRLLRNFVLSLVLPNITSNPGIGNGMFRYFSQLGVKYQRSSVVDTAPAFNGPVRGGFRAPDGRIQTADAKESWVHDLLRGSGYHLLFFSEDPSQIQVAEKRFLEATDEGTRVHVICSKKSNDHKAAVDVDNKLHREYGFESSPGYVLVRPDGYVENIGYLETFDELLGCLKA